MPGHAMISYLESLALIVTAPSLLRSREQQADHRLRCDHERAVSSMLEGRCGGAVDGLAALIADTP